jgi:hypothetical protein
MRTASASSLKRDSDKRQALPREGTRLRFLYDLFQSNRGKIVSFSLARAGKDVASLVDFYGLDIRTIGKRRWLLAGEWQGKEYVDYVLAEQEKREARVRKIAESRVHRNAARDDRKAKGGLTELAEDYPG